jgi:hypothetical protein
MAAARPSPTASPNLNRRRRVRHKIQTPAYASFTGASQGAMLELHEIVNISEDGVAIQCSSPIEADRIVNLCLDLAECNGQIFTTSQVIWASPNGLAGLRFSELSPVSLFRLREWLFLNVMAGASNADASTLAASSAELRIPAVSNYSDMLATATAVQRQVEALGTDLPAALQLIADRSQTLLRASGAALALATSDPDVMECRASSGSIAPPIGTRLQVGSGFSGECVKSGQLLRCDDTELDSRVDRESCRALGIRSILAAPVRAGEKSVGIIETFSDQPNHFTERDSKILQRFAETVLAAVNRVAPVSSQPPKPAADNFGPRPGSVLFASEPEPEKKDDAEKHSSGITLPRSLLILLVGIAITIATALGYILAPWIQAEAAPWVQTKIHARAHAQLPTVLASTHAPKPDPLPTVETATLDQLKQIAVNGDAAAQNALGLRYAQADGVPLDDRQAANWFEKAAENGNVAAQSKLGAILLTGRGVPQNFSQAYFWIALARASGDEASKIRAPLATKNLTRDQVASIELDANRWLQQHSPTKPPAGH